MKQKQRRNEMRTNYDLYIPVKKLMVSDQKLINLPKALPVNVVNISASGILLKSSLNIPSYIEFCFDLPLENRLISCTAETVRKERFGNCYYYGCKLHTINVNDKLLLRKFVLKKQLNLLNTIRANLKPVASSTYRRR